MGKGRFQTKAEDIWSRVRRVYSGIFDSPEPILEKHVKVLLTIYNLPTDS